MLDLEPVADVGEVLAAQVAAARVHAQRAAAPLHRRRARGHARRPARRARRLARARPDAAQGGEGARRARRPRPRPARRRPGARPAGAHAPAAARPRVGSPAAPRSCATCWSEFRRCDASAPPPARHRRARAGPLPGGCDLRLGVALRARRGAVRDRGRVHSVGAARGPGRPDRAPGRAAHGGGGRALPRSGSRSPGLLPPPGGELVEPLLGWPVSIAGRWSAARADRRALRAPRTPRARARAARDPRPAQALLARAGRPAGGEELLVLPRIEPVTAPGGGDAAPGSRAAGASTPG